MKMWSSYSIIGILRDTFAACCYPAAISTIWFKREAAFRISGGGFPYLNDGQTRRLAEQGDQAESAKRDPLNYAAVLQSAQYEIMPRMARVQP